MITAAAGSAALAVAAWLAQRERTTTAPDGGSPGAAASPALTEDELHDIAALALLIFPSRDDVPPQLIERTARFWAQGRVRRMVAPPPYRAGIRELNAVAGGRFRALSPAVAQRVVSDLVDRPPDSPFRRAAADLIHGLYTSVPGWRLVGYPSAPGYAAGPDAYTRPVAPA